MKLAVNSDDHEAWRKRIHERLPDLAQRVFALRGKQYEGYGFHWHLEMQLGKLIAYVNDYDAEVTKIRVIAEDVLAQRLFQQVKNAERSLTPTNS